LANAFVATLWKTLQTIDAPHSAFLGTAKVFFQRRPSLAAAGQAGAASSGRHGYRMNDA
jgi:hypothetical protein